jgi:amidohydrolase
MTKRDRRDTPGECPAPLRSVIEKKVGDLAPQLIALSHALHADPEIGFQEYRAAERVAGCLQDLGFAVETGICDLPTALRASKGTGELQVGICAEYDALPGLGHACGHNIIAAIAVGAAAALGEVADDLGLQVRLLGTPAEEGGGGKILMLERGAFDGLSFAMMAHPGPVDVASATPLAVSHLRISYSGKSAHAGAYPEEGVDAADAFTIAQVAIGLLRPRFSPAVRVHGIVTEAGVSPNAVPEHAEGRWYVRARNLVELADVRARVLECFRAGAVATGCGLDVRQDGPDYSEFREDSWLTQRYRVNVERLGRQCLDQGPGVNQRIASTDMANVSLVLPSIHPYIGISSLPATNHQPAFAQACVAPAADTAILDGAVAIALTGADVATDETQRRRLVTV